MSEKAFHCKLPWDGYDVIMFAQTRSKARYQAYRKAIDNDVCLKSELSLIDIRVCREPQFDNHKAIAAGKSMKMARHNAWLQKQEAVND